MNFRRFFGLAALSLGLLLFGGLQQYAQATTDYSNSEMMDDVVFNKVNSLTEAQIQSFLGGQSGPYTTLAGGSPCLTAYQTPNFHWDGASWHYGTDSNWNTAWGSANISAAAAVYQAAQMWGINPEVILATLEKEESLVSGSSCDGGRYQSAMGYDCPDSGGCSSTYAGFTKQVLWGSWQLEFGQERSEGNLAWDGDGDIQYVGYMTAGTYQRCDNSSTCPPTLFDGSAVIDGQTIQLANGATASLYSYTPHLNQSFPGIFEQWFGSTLVPRYAWQVSGQYAYTDASKTTGAGTVGMLPGTEVYVGVTALNSGNTTWTNSGPNAVELGTWDPEDRMSAFCDNWSNGCNRPATLQQASVAPGQTGTFEFWMKAPSTPGTYPEHFDLLMSGVAWFPDQGLTFYSTVVPPVYSWQPAGQFAYTDQTMTTGKGTTGLLPGDRVWVGFTAKNTGNVTWKNSGPNPIHVGTTDPTDRSSQVYDPSWLGPNRPALMQQASVAPGQTGTFEFWIDAQKPGTYLEHFGLVAEGAAWMNDPGLNFYVTVQTPVYSWQPAGQFGYTDQTMTTGASTVGMHAGHKVWVGFSAKSTGNVTWKNSGPNPIYVGTTDPTDRLSAFFDGSWLGQNRPALMQQASVAPGQTGTFGWWMQAPSKTGIYIEHFGLVAEGAAWMNDPGLNFYMTVVP